MLRALTALIQISRGWRPRVALRQFIKGLRAHTAFSRIISLRAPTALKQSIQSSGAQTALGRIIRGLRPRASLQAAADSS